MVKVKIIFFLSFVLSIYLFSRGAMSENKKELINLVLKDGTVVIETRSDLAPKHVAQIKNLVENGKYDGVVFHRVIQDFMAQTGEVRFGNSSNASYNLSRAGTGGSGLSDVEAVC